MMTNEEKIKAMSREEMAEAMAGKIGLPEYCADVCPEHIDCVRCAFEWLGEEAESEKENATDLPYKILRRLDEGAKESV